MLDISIPWSAMLLMAPILMPWLAIPAALLAGYGWYRRKTSFYAAVVAAFVASFVAPWLLLLAVALFDRSAHISGLGKGLLALLVLLSIGGLVLWGVGRADSRNRHR